MACCSPLEESAYEEFPPDYKNDYREIKLLGEGNFGQVYEVVHKMDNNSYAIKKMLVEGSHNELTRSIGNNFWQIQREISCLTKLKSEYIVEYVNSWREDNCYYIQLEKCDTDLRKILVKKHQWFDRKEEDCMKLAEYVFSLELMKEITNGVMYLHNNGHMHRDIKPENIMVNFNSQNQHVKIGDFGLTVFHDIRYSFHSHTRMVGTFKYMSPEAHDKYYDFKSDVYSLAMVSSELFNKNIFKGEFNFDELIKEKAIILNDIINKMMITPNYKERYCCEEIIKKLNNLNIERNFILKSDDYKQIELKRNDSELDDFIFRFLSVKINGENYTYNLRKNIFNSFKKRFSFKRKSISSYTLREEPISDYQSIPSMLENEPSIRIDRNEIDLLYRIGEGSCGTVHFGIWKLRSGRVKIEVAIKISNEFDYQHIKAFLDEALLMRNFEHENVLKIYGVSFQSDRSPMIILPFLRNGDLLSYLRDKSNSPRLRTLIDFATDAAKGLEYLSKLNLVHRDIAARNCMITDDLRVQIADFGLSKYMKNSNYYISETERPMPIRWMAMECIEKGFFNEKTDIWSYGVLVWEIFSLGHIPYSNLRNSSVYYHLQGGTRLSKPKICPDPFYDIIFKCWSTDPDDRPNFTEIILEIDKMMTTFEEPIFSEGEYIYSDIYSSNNSSNYSSNYQIVDSNYLEILNFEQNNQSNSISNHIISHYQNI